MLPGHPARLKSFNNTGFHRYFLTFCTDRRQPLFCDRRAVKLILEQISRASTECGFAVLAYCFMPDHLHLLIYGESDAADCRRFISLAKQYSGFYFKRRFGIALWQRYGYERTLRNGEETAAVAKYIVENPVRAELVKDVHDYEFVGSLVYGIDELLEWAVSSQEWSA